MNKTRVLLCKRLSGLHWTVLGCTGLWWAVLGCTGLYWTELVFTKLNCAVRGCSRPYCGVLGGVNSYLSVYSAIFGMVTNEQPNKQVILEQLLLTSVRRQSFAIHSLDYSGHNSTKHAKLSVL